MITDKEKIALQKLHIRYIHYCLSVQTDPRLNFWGIKSFKDYLLSFARSHLCFFNVKPEVVVDIAVKLGYTLEE